MNEMQFPPKLRTDGYYRSSPMVEVQYQEGQRNEEEYFLYYQFLDNGIWISKTHASPLLNFPAFLKTINFQLILADPNHDEPQLANKELFYQSGQYVQMQDRLRLYWQHSELEEKQRQWEFLLRQDRLETVLGEYHFDFLPLAEQ